MAREEVISMSIMSGTKFMVAIGGTAVLTAGFVLQSALPRVAVGEGPPRDVAVVQAGSFESKEPAPEITISGGSAADPASNGRQTSDGPFVQQTPQDPTKATVEPAIGVGFVDMKHRMPSELKVLDKLESDTHVEMVDTTIGEMREWLQQYHEISIIIDHQALADLGLTTDSPVPDINLRGIRLRDALDIILTQLQLAYVLRNGVLWITSSETAATTLETHVYKLDRSLGASAKELAENILPKMVDSDSWENVGGASSIAVYKDGIIVSAPMQTHWRIKDLLEQIGREARSK
jgi:hypothetical protein